MGKWTVGTEGSQDGSEAADHTKETPRAPAAVKSHGSPLTRTTSPLGGVVMMLVILSLVLAFIGLRHLNKLRNTRRMLGVYNQLNAGTQVTNTMRTGDSGGTALQQGAGVAALRQPEVILTARPWKSASPSKSQAAGVFGLLDFRGSGGTA